MASEAAATSTEKAAVVDVARKKKRKQKEKEKRAVLRFFILRSSEKAWIVRAYATIIVSDTKKKYAFFDFTSEKISKPLSFFAVL